MLKFAHFQIIEAFRPDEAASIRTAHRAAFTYKARPGFILVRSRAISSRCNDNFDEFPADEIKTAYRTFVGKPVFVNHHNADHRRARGVIVDAVLHEDTNPDGSPDTWVEVLMEVDAVRFPRLAEAILTCTCGHKHSAGACDSCGCQQFDGQISRTSMGCDVAYSKCSFCGNKAVTPLDYCDHIKRHKGRRIRRRRASGGADDVLVREICYGLRFFENSLLVEEPADPTAYFLGVDASGLTAAASIISEGMTVEIGDVATYLDKLAGIVSEAVSKESKREVFNLCEVSVPGTNLFCDGNKGHGRASMPQLSDPDGNDITDEFREHLEAIGHRVTNRTVVAAGLKATQGELIAKKVAGIYESLKAGKDTDGIRKRIFVSQDNYIVDGHHRWAALCGYDLIDGDVGDVSMDIAQVDMGIDALMREAKQFAASYGVKQRGMDDKAAAKKPCGCGQRTASKRTARGPLDISVNEYGMTYDPEAARSDWLAAAREWDGWNRVPPVAVPLDGLIATEALLSSQSINKVVSGGEAFRAGYDPHLIIDRHGRKVIVDGHHRVAMHIGRGDRTMPAKVVDLSALSLAASSLQAHIASRTALSGSIWRTRSTGTYHRSMNCPHINGEIVEPVSVEDVNEAGVVARYGANACTSCFPSAPTRRTAGADIFGVRLGADGRYWDVGSREDAYRVAQEESADGWKVYVVGRYGDRVATFEDGKLVWERTAIRAKAYERKTRTPEWDEEDERLHPRNRGKFTDGAPQGAAPAAPKATDSFTPDEKPGAQPVAPEAPAQPAGAAPAVDTSQFVPHPNTTGVGSKEDPVRTESVEDAAAALALGLHVELSQPKQVSTLLDKLSEQIAAAKASGSKLDIDLCNVTVKGTNLFCAESKGIPRIKMPQLKVAGERFAPDSRAVKELQPNAKGEYDLQPLFLQHLKDQGYTAEETQEAAVNLKATQNQLNGGKIAGMTDALLSGKSLGDEPIFVSEDDYIVDGHHRWAANAAADYADNTAGDFKMSIWRINIDIITLLDLSNKFAAEYGAPQAGVTASKRPCSNCGPSLDEMNAHARAKMAMADRSGIPEVDRLIEDFLDETLDERNWGEGAGTVRDLMDGARSFGMCQVITEQFVEFVKARGFKAYATDTDRREMKYRTRGKPPGGNTFFYFEHTVASVYPPGEWPSARWSNGDSGEVYIDFSASQYGYKDHPKVIHGSKTAADIYDKRHLKGDVFAFEHNGRWLLGEATKVRGGVATAIVPFGTTEAIPAEGLELLSVPRHVIVDPEGLRRAYSPRGFASKEEAAHYAWGFTMANGPLTEHMEQSGQWTSPRPPWFRSDKEYQDHMRRTREMVDRTEGRTSAMAKNAYQYADGRKLDAAELGRIAIEEGFLTPEQVGAIGASNKHAYTDLEKVLRKHLHSMWAKGLIDIGPFHDYLGPDDTWAAAEDRATTPMPVAASLTPPRAIPVPDLKKV